MSYRSLPAKRVYIPKGDSKEKRPLGIACYEDKFVEHTIADTNIVRLIKRCLKAGIVEEGNWEASEAGTPQGSIISPVLGNLYLHYTIDLWFTKVVAKKSRGQASMVRYADDSVFCFQYKDDAERFYAELKSRLAKFGLEIAENKTKIIEFGRFAEENRARRGMGKPETLDFLGFTHYCSKSRQGKFRVKRRTSRKKYRTKIKEFTQWMKTNRHSSIHEIFKQVKVKLEGHYRYYGITDNSRMLDKYRYEVTKTIFKWMNRRSQKRSFDYDRFNKYLKVNPLPTPKIHVNIYE